MSWSMGNISFRMAGSGSWQNLLPDESAKHFYGRIYPDGIDLKDVDNQLHPVIENWQKGNIIQIDRGRILPIGPVITDKDLDILDSWIRDISSTMCDAVRNHLSEYRLQAENIARKGNYSPEKVNNILTIQVCAHTLDSWVFSRLRKEVMGTYSPRDFAGTFFFWGYGFSTGAKRIFGFTSYGASRWLQIHVLRSHGLDRENLKSVLRRYDTLNLIQQVYLNDQGISLRKAASVSLNPLVVHRLRNINLLEKDDPPHLSIPVFTEKEMRPAAALYETVTHIIFHRFMDTMTDLEKRVAACSFHRCVWSDILCMLFHLSYSYAADALVENGTIPEFPQSAGGEWGVWIH